MAVISQYFFLRYDLYHENCTLQNQLVQNKNPAR